MALGNVSVSALLRASSSALERNAQFEDATAAYDFALSAKTDADFAKYVGHLKNRAGAITDPVKQLALQKTMDSARNQYQSATIQRINTQINYGNMSLQDKSNALQSLRDQAISIGDMDQAQSLEYQYTSVDKQIQNEAEATARAGSAKSGGNGGYDTGLGKGYADKLKEFDGAEKQLKEQLATGKITANQFAVKMSVLNGGGSADDGTPIAGREQLYKQLDSDQTGLSEDDAQKLFEKYSSFIAGDDYKKYNSYTGGLIKSGDVGFGEKRTQTGVDANGKPVYSSEIVQLKKVGSSLDEKGNTIPQFEAGRRAGDSGTFIRNMASGGGITKRVEDLFKVQGENDYGYINDEQGKRFVGKTITLPSGKQGEFTAKNLADLKSLEDPNPKFSAGFGIDQYLNDLKNVPRDIGDAVNAIKPEAGKLLGKVGNPLNPMNVPHILGGLLTGDIKKRQQEADIASAAQRNAALVADRAKQQALLPVFQAPAYKAPAPVANKPKYSFNPAPLPGQAGYVNAIDQTKATIANPKSTAKDALKSLIGF